LDVAGVEELLARPFDRALLPKPFRLVAVSFDVDGNGLGAEQLQDLDHLQLLQRGAVDRHKNIPVPQTPTPRRGRPLDHLLNPYLMMRWLALVVKDEPEAVSCLPGNLHLELDRFPGMGEDPTFEI
jgi:hypothetical protein